MATFTSIPDTDLDGNSPITEPLMLALRDNPLAIAQGDASAPNIQTDALQDALITNAKMANNSVGVDQMIDNSVGNDELKKAFQLDGTFSVTGAGYFTIPSGWYVIVTATTSIDMQIFSSGVWRTSAYSPSCLVVSDGTNIRFYNSGVISSVYYKKLA